MKKTLKAKEGGFTLIEILVVIGIIAILAAVVLIAINPARQFGQARDSQRVSNVNAILNSIGQNMADNNGLFDCGGVGIPSVTTNIDSGAGYNMRDCIVPNYMSEIPVDPVGGSAWDGTAYDTAYTIVQDPATLRVTITAQAEIDKNDDGIVDANDIIQITR